jgi:hypothetical protein
VTPAGKYYSTTSIKRMLGEGGSKSRALMHHDAKGAAAASLARIAAKGRIGAGM